MKLRHFEVLGVEGSAGSAGPDRGWKIHYKAIRNKQWITGYCWMIARTAKEAKEEAYKRFPGK